MSTLLTMVYYKKDKTYRIRMTDSTGMEIEHVRTFKTQDGARQFMIRLEEDVLRVTGSKHQWQDVPMRKN